MASSAQITTWISEVEGQRHKVAMGQTFVELWRDGRKVRVEVPNIDALNAYLTQLKSDLVQAQVDEGVTPTRRRRAVGIAYRN